MPVSTVYRYIKLLKEHGFVVNQGMRYRCGPAMEPRRDLAPEHRRVAGLARPFLEQLSDLTGQTTTLAARDALTEALCVHQVSPPRSAARRIAFRIGQRLPLYAGSGQRALLAFAPDPVVNAILDGKLERFTPNTPDNDELKRKIASTRRSWVTISRAEYVPGAFAIAVPIAVNGEVGYSLTISGPQARCDAAWQRRAKPILLHASRELGHRLQIAPA